MQYHSFHTALVQYGKKKDQYMVSQGWKLVYMEDNGDSLFYLWKKEGTPNLNAPIEHLVDADREEDD